MDEQDQANRLLVMGDVLRAMTVRVAATLRIGDHIAGGLRTVPELAEATHTQPQLLKHLLRHLAKKGVLTVDEADRYELTSVGEALRDDHPGGARQWLDLTSTVGRADLSLVGLLDSLRTGEPAFPRHFGRSFWEDLEADPERNEATTAQWGREIALDAPAVLDAYDWGALGHVIDVGGGVGALLSAVLHRFPTLRGTVFDQPDTAEIARKRLAAAGLADRAEAIGGDFFGPLPPGAGGYLLSTVLHSLTDDAVRTVLRRCAEAAGQHGRVFVIERIGPDGENIRTAMSLRMLVYFGGRERGADELTELAAGAGLKRIAVHAADALAVVEFGAH